MVAGLEPGFVIPVLEPESIGVHLALQSVGAGLGNQVIRAGMELGFIGASLQFGLQELTCSWKGLQPESMDASVVLGVEPWSLGGLSGIRLHQGGLSSGICSKVSLLLHSLLT
jgi:hypothetical protein